MVVTENSQKIKNILLKQMNNPWQTESLTLYFKNAFSFRSTIISIFSFDSTFSAIQFCWNVLFSITLFFALFTAIEVKSPLCTVWLYSLQLRAYGVFACKILWQCFGFHGKKNLKRKSVGSTAFSVILPLVNYLIFSCPWVCEVWNLQIK